MKLTEPEELSHGSNQNLGGMNFEQNMARSLDPGGGGGGGGEEMIINENNSSHL